MLHRLIAITPARSKTYSWEEVNNICYEYAVSAADTFAKLPRDGKHTPLRFLYVSGFNATQDPGKKPWFLGDYCVMRVCILCHCFFNMKANDA
jgi:hypothetical protein